MSDVNSTPLGQAYGYGIVLGLGFAFAIFMVSLDTFTTMSFTQTHLNTSPTDCRYSHPQTIQQ